MKTEDLAYVMPVVEVLLMPVVEVLLMPVVEVLLMPVRTEQEDQTVTWMQVHNALKTSLATLN